MITEWLMYNYFGCGIRSCCALMVTKGRIKKSLWLFPVHLPGLLNMGTLLPPHTLLYMESSLKEAGGGPKVPAGQEIACHFSQDHTMVTKILDFIHKHPNLKVVKSFFHYLDRFFRNLAKTNKKVEFFGIEKPKIYSFSIFW